MKSLLPRVLKWQPIPRTLIVLGLAGRSINRDPDRRCTRGVPQPTAAAVIGRAVSNPTGRLAGDLVEVHTRLGDQRPTV